MDNRLFHLVMDLFPEFITLRRHLFLVNKKVGISFVTTALY